MERTNKSEGIIKGPPRPVQIEAIERELTRLWKSVGETAETDQPAVMRACSLNLLVYVEGDGSVQEVDDWIAPLISQHPPRAIVMIANDHAAASKLEAWISAHCKLPTSDGKQICCEQVMLRAEGDAINELPSTVAPLLVPDLPVFLWWRGRPRLESEIFSRLTATSDRVLLDSAAFPNPEADLFKLAKLVRDRSVRVAFGDLNWTRLTPWRELTAQFFDAPNFRPYLSQINKVVIQYHAGRKVSNPVQAILIAGWLASRLQWKPYAYRAMGQDKVLSLSQGDRTITVDIQAMTSQVDTSSDLTSLTLMAEKDGFTTEFSISKTEDPMCIGTCVSKTGANPIRRVVRIEAASEAELVGKELEILGHDLTYEEALDVVTMLRQQR